MKKPTDRRSFMRKLTALSGLAVVAPGMALSETRKENKTMDKPIVKKVKALGFQWETLDPFLFCVHHEDFYPEGNAVMGPKASLEGRQMGQDFLIKDGWRMYHGRNVPGFPGHPHRGFETVTVVRTGFVDHTDSQGASGRYGNGDVQWMTAGKGVQHAEMFPLIKEKEDNPLELFQIWLNLPKANKFVEPHFKMLWSEGIPVIEEKDENGKAIYAEVVAGVLQGEKAPTPPPNSWATPKENEVAIWNIRLEAGAKWTLPAASEGVNRKVYFYKGDVLNVADTEIPFYHGAEVRAEVELELTAGKEDASILILQGKPIGEPVVQHGPFVMNTREEIKQAFSDYQKDHFGGWPWDSADPVHPRTKGRFAKHADGTEEIKD